MRAAEFVRDALALAVPYERGHGRVVMTLGLYFDKSGPTGEIPAVAVAGVISTVEKWVGLTEEWNQALHDFEDLPYFHMTDYDSGKSYYEDWQARGLKQERFGRLLDIIEKYVMGAICTSVSVADCTGWSPDPPVEVGFGLAGSYCMNAMPQFRYLVERPAEQVVYVFEEGDKGYGKLEAVYDKMLQTPWRREYNRIGGKLVTDQKKFPPLQVADIFAFEGWKQWAREFGGETRPTRYPYARLTQSIPGEWRTLRRMRPSDTALEMAKMLGIPATLEDARTHPLLAMLDAVVGQIPTAPLTLPSWG